MIIVKAKIKDIAQKEGDFNVAGDFSEKLDHKVKEIIKDACRRAKENNRKTVMGRDI